MLNYLFDTGNNYRGIDYLILWLQTKVEDREMEVKDVLENYTNLEKECESAKQPISVELQVSIRMC